MNKGAFFLCLSMMITLGGRLPAAPPLESAAPAVERAKILAAAEQYLGVPYRYGGMSRRGLDCSGLVYLSFQEALSAEVPRIAADLYHWTERIPDPELQTGDLVFFRRSGKIFHVGIYAADDRFIHAASDGPKTGVIYSRLGENFWKGTYAGAGRVLPAGEAAMEDPFLRPAEEDQTLVRGFSFFF